MFHTTQADHVHSQRLLQVLVAVRSTMQTCPLSAHLQNIDECEAVLKRDGHSNLQLLSLPLTAVHGCYVCERTVKL